MNARTILPTLVLFGSLVAGPSRAADPFQPGIPDSQVQRLDVARRLGTDAAIEAITQILKENPAYYRAHYNLGLVYLNAGRPKESLPHLERALALREAEGSQIRDSTIYNSLGWAQYLSGDLDSAEKTFQKGLAEASDAPRASKAKLFNNLGTLYLEKGEVEAARKYYTEAASKYGSEKAKANLKYLGSYEGIAAQASAASAEASSPPSP